MTNDIMSAFIPEISERTARDLEEILSMYRSGRLRRQGQAAPKHVDDAEETWHQVTVSLLDDLTRTTVVPAIVLGEKLREYTIDVVILGWPASNGLDATFQLRINSVPYTIPLQATAKEFADITKLKGTVRGGTVTRSGGNLLVDPRPTYTVYHPMRWWITYSSKKEAPKIEAGAPQSDLWFVQVAESLDRPTGRIVNVRCALPTGWTTPLRAGAICETVKRSGGIYRVVGAEARYWYAENTTSSY
jgi:hypothetical protein